MKIMEMRVLLLMHGNNCSVQTVADRLGTSYQCVSNQLKNVSAAIPDLFELSESGRINFINIKYSGLINRLSIIIEQIDDIEQRWFPHRVAVPSVRPLKDLKTLNSDMKTRMIRKSMPSKSDIKKSMRKKWGGWGK